MHSASPDEIFPLFIGLWLVLGLGGFALFTLNKNAALKRRLRPPFVVATAVLFIGSLYLMDPAGQLWLYMLPVIALIAGLNLRMTKFCDTCGRTTIHPNIFSKAEFCSRCRAKLQE